MASVEASCVCGAVRLQIAWAPEEVTDCNCKLCRRYGALWAYYSPKDVQRPAGVTDVFMRGPKRLEFHRCKNCGCVTHWEAIYKEYDRMGINARLLPPEVLARARVEHCDGAGWRT
jgi:hypothetical protein